MSKRDDLKVWVLEAVVAQGGEATPLDVAKHIWAQHEGELRKSDIFYTWQYDMRWAAQVLRTERKLGLSPRRRWTALGQRP